MKQRHQLELVRFRDLSDSGGSARDAQSDAQDNAIGLSVLFVR
jgi:hypothetical protein